MTTGGASVSCGRVKGEGEGKDKKIGVRVLVSIKREMQEDGLRRLA